MGRWAGAHLYSVIKILWHHLLSTDGSQDTKLGGPALRDLGRGAPPWRCALRALSLDNRTAGMDPELSRLTAH